MGLLRPDNECSNRRACCLWVVGATILFLALSPASRAGQPTLVVQGSTTFNSELMESHAREIAEAAQVELKVVPNKSNLGLVALLDGTADLAMTSAPLSAEKEFLRKARPGTDLDQLREFIITQTRAVLIVHPANPVRTVPDDDVRRILSGEILGWLELGGENTPIRIVAAREGGGVVTTVETHFLGAGKHVSAPRQIRAQTGPQIVRIVEQEPGAVGITDSRLIKGRRVVELSSASPIRQTLFLVSKGEPSPAMLAFIAACRAAATSAELQ